MYDNVCKTKENENWTKDKIEPQHKQLGPTRVLEYM